MTSQPLPNKSRSHLDYFPEQRTTTFAVPASRVIDGNVPELPALVIASPVLTGDAMGPSTRCRGARTDSSELFDVDVQQLAEPRSLIALCVSRPTRPSFPSPDPGQDPRDGGGGTSAFSAISAAIIHNH